MDRKLSNLMLCEMQEFASFSAAEQRFIRRSLDNGLGRCEVRELWARSQAEAIAIDAQARRYRGLDLLRACIPDDDAADEAESFLASLITISSSDLREGKLAGFDAYRFLYERLIGAGARPWLVSAFCAAAAQPGIQPDRRKQLLQSISVIDVTAAGWSIRSPIFYPEWVEKVQEAVN